MNRKLLYFFIVSLIPVWGMAQKYSYDGISVGMNNLSKLSMAESRSISPENLSGEPGKGGMADLSDKDVPNKANAWYAARELGQGWKVNPYIDIQAQQTITIADIEGPGAIQHIWMTPTGNWRFTIIRIYWDDEQDPSVECPIGDFFASAYNRYAQLSSLAICVNPGSAFNCYWPMPFRKKCRITIENIDETPVRLYFQINYVLTEVGDEQSYFHAQFRRSNPTQGALHTLVDGIKGTGHYVGTYIAYRVHDNGWWGEGEMKFYIDSDKKFPTICGTGVEDYFCGSYNFENQETHRYQEYTTPYAGMHQVIRPDGLYNAVTSFGLYRWHIMDPIRFKEGLKVIVQDLGWRSGRRYNKQQSDISSVSFWYQKEPHAPFVSLPSKNELEIP